jgi:NitT/TauT family transport system substrate-binding protein
MAARVERTRLWYKSKKGLDMEGMKKSLVAICVGALAGVVSLVACEVSTSNPQVTVRIGVFPTQDYLPYFIMQEQGFDKKNGLRFEEVSHPGGAAILEAMAAGLTDVGYVGDVPFLVAAERNLIPAKAISVAANNFADPQHPGVAVLAGESVKDWQALRGKQIAVAAVNSIHGSAIKSRMALEGVKDYTLVEIPFANEGLAVAGGNVAAAVMSEPFLTQSLLRGDGHLLGWVVGGAPFERTEFTLIVFRAEFLRANPQGVKAFLRAHLQAVEWMTRNPEAARSILARRLGLTKEVGAKINLLRWPPDARNDLAALVDKQQALVRVGMLHAPTPVRQLYDETLLNEVLAEKR